MLASGASGPDVRSSTRFVPAFEAAPRLAWAVASDLAVGLDAALGPNLARDRYTLNDGTRFVTRTGPLAASSEAFVAWRFR